MKTLTTVHLVQFSFWEYETFYLSQGGTAFIGPNGAGKTSLVDAIQIALVGAHGSYLQFNAQSVQKDARSLRDYALGAMRSGDGDKGAMTRKRDEAMSYITLVFRDEETGESLSAGLAVWSTERERLHRVLGLYVLPGVRLDMEHHLEDLGEQGKAPLEWGLFDAQARRLTAAAGRSPSIGTKPESYLDELLHNLADHKQSIDPRKFLKALKQSIKLKDVNSVNDFLRENLVDATKIDKRGTLLHIQTLRRLAQQIEEVEKQLAELDLLSGRYDHIARLHRTRAVTQAVLLQLKVESADAAAAQLQQATLRLSEQIKEADDALQVKADAIRSTFETYEDLHGTLKADPEAGAPEQARQLMKATAEARLQARRAVEQLELTISEALASLALAFEGRYVEAAQGMAQASRVWDSRRGRGELTGAAQVQEALQLLDRARAAAGQLAGADAESLRKASKIKETTEEKLAAANKGVRVRDDDVAGTIRLFDNAGIRCHTVASVVQIKDVAWQSALETFLGRNRYAIVVEAGREREAVALMRGSDIAEVTVVQPNHLRDLIGRPPERGSVAELLDSQDPVSLAFFSRILGKMRRVETEEELEMHPRALTKDCMLSANGGTKRMRPIDPRHWVLGIQLSSVDLTELREELVAAIGDEKRAKERASLSSDAGERLRAALRTVTLNDFASALTSFESASARAESAADPTSLHLPQRLQELQELVNTARTRHTDAQQAHADAASALTGLRKDLDAAAGELVVAHTTLAALNAERADALCNQDYDADLAATRIESAYQAGEAMVTQVLENLADEMRKADSSITKLIPDVRDQFVDFITLHSIGLIDERSDWRKATSWIKRHSAKLRDSTLATYKTEAAAAREAAEKAFESDVKYSLREALRRVEREIRDLNGILDRCPPFTNGERYHFAARIDDQHRPLYNLIVQQSSDGETVSLFDSHEVQDKLVRLMEAAEIGADKGNNPLEDYRLFYQFDLEIRVDGKVVDLLSKRMGVASNGEHRVPFYVIAGAALATAYRIKPGERHQSAGVMILDEAFYGIDAQNTVVTAEFLKSLGLQLVMAGPDSDTSKLTAVLDSYYDLTRFGSDVFVERVGIKEKARQLMQSDMPERNPQLIARAIEQLTLEAK